MYFLVTLLVCEGNEAQLGPLFDINLSRGYDKETGNAIKYGGTYCGILLVSLKGPGPHLAGSGLQNM